MAMKKIVNGFTHVKKNFFMFYFRFTDGDQFFHITKSGASYLLESSFEIKSNSKRIRVCKLIEDIFPRLKNLLTYSGVIKESPKFLLSPIEDYYLSEISASYLPMGDIEYVKEELKKFGSTLGAYDIADYSSGLTLIEPKVDRLNISKENWTDDEVMMNNFFKDKTKLFVKPKYFERFLLAYRYLTEGALMLEGNFGVGKSFLVESLSNLDKRLASTTVISSMREGDLLGKVSALPDGSVGLVLSEIVSSLKKGYTVSVEEPNVNEFVQSLRQTFDGKYYLTINGERQFIDPEGLAVFSINSRRFVGQSDKVTKDLDNRFASRIAYSISVPDLTDNDITDRLLAVTSQPFNWDDYKKQIYKPNRNIRYYGSTLEFFYTKLSNFLTAMSRDSYASKYISYFQPYLVAKYFTSIAISHDLTYEEFKDLIYMATINKIRWNSINEVAMNKVEDDIKSSLDWERRVKTIWNSYPFQYVEATLISEVDSFGEDIDSELEEEINTPIKEEETNVNESIRDWSNLDTSLEDEADDVLN